MAENSGKWKTIFVVDDNDTNLSRAEESLENHYNVMTIPSSAKMFTLLNKIKPDLILLDIEMPEMSGFQAMELLKATDEYANIPVIFLTGVSSAEVEAEGFELGAVDFISKPFSTPVLLNRMKLHIGVNDLVKERTAALEHAHRSILLILADLVESRDEGTGGHIERSTQYIRLLINEMKAQCVYEDELATWELKNVAICAALHDVGKIAVSDVILNKPGKLTVDEYADMKNHAVVGAEIINRVISHTGENSLLDNAKLFAEYHHENWDGTGYPHGLKGLEIPLQGRIMAIADVYDALVSVRPYKTALTDDEAANIIIEESGKRFDPAIVKVFISIKDKFKEVRRIAMNE